MGRVKGSMLTLHLLTAAFDIYLSFFTMPIIIFPIISGYTLGFLNYIGMPMWFIIPVGYCMFFFVLISIILFFENRYNYLVRHDSECPSRTKKRAVVYFVNYFLAIICVIIMFQGIKNTEGYREIALKKLPCLPSRILEKPDFFMLKMDISITLSGICAYCFINSSQILFYFFGTSHYLYRTKAQSTRTSQLQKKFFKSLCVQISVPMAAFAAPCIYFLCTVLTNNFDLVISNFGMLGVCSHGLVSTIIMLLVHKPYREATLEIIRFKGSNRVNAESFIVAKPSISNIK